MKGARGNSSLCSKYLNKSRHFFGRGGRSENLKDEEEQVPPMQWILGNMLGCPSTHPCLPREENSIRNAKK